MLLVLDTNEYLFALDLERKASCEALLDLISSSPQRYELKICRTIVEEVGRNAVPRYFKDFWYLLESLGVAVDEDWEVPFVLATKYETLGLKPGDAFIAGYAEYVGAEYLITENRKDFLAHPDWFPFRVTNAEAFLKRTSI